VAILILIAFHSCALIDGSSEHYSKICFIIKTNYLLRKAFTLNIIDQLLETAQNNGQASLSEYDSKRVLAAYGIPAVSETMALSPEEAAKAAEQMDFPSVVKGLGSRLLHKTEMGLVHLNLHNESAVLEAAQKITESAGSDLEGFLVQPFVEGKREWVAGMFRDPQFGPVIMFGAGGIFAEALSDVSLRLAPLTTYDAEAMLDEIKAQPLLGDFRGEKSVDRQTLMTILMGLSRLAVEHPCIAEIDINPLVTRNDGSLVAVAVW